MTATATAQVEPAKTWHLDARPLLKWAGGKTRLLDPILSTLPATAKRYIEPMCGGAAVFFAYGPNAEKRVIADANPRLIETYQAIADDPESVYEYLTHLATTDSAEKYYERRVRFNADNQDVTNNAGLFLYLNRACYNGLWRVNNKGEFNVPYGKYKKVAIPSWDDFKASALALNAASIEYRDFRFTLDFVGEGDVIYVDPPYPGEDMFKGYAAGGFSDKDHRELALACEAAAGMGAFVLVSIGDHPLSRELYGMNDVQELSARCSVGATAERRGQRAELLVRIMTS